MEQDDANVLGNRMERMWESCGAAGGCQYLPFNMADSGFKFSTGPVSYYKVYKGLVDAELARAPKGDISASYTRVGNHVEADVTVKNLTGITISWEANRAHVGILVYEDYKVGVTNRFVRAATGNNLYTPLENGVTTPYHIVTDDLAVVDWNKVHVVAFADYSPTGGSGPYDMLQAAIAPSFSVAPASLSFTINQDPPNDPQANVTISGWPVCMPWTVVSKPSWVTVTPGSGTVNTNTTAVVQVDGSALQAGSNTGTITFSATNSGTTIYKTVSITAVYNPPAPSLNIQPTSVSLLVSQEPPNDPQATIQVNGVPQAMAWSVESKPDWVTVTPSTGVMGAQVVVRADGSALSLGSTPGVIRFTGTFQGVTTYQDVPVTATYPQPDINIQPGSVSLLVNQEPPNDPETTLQINGSLTGIPWTVESKPAWVSVTPASGTTNTTAVVRVDGSALEVGSNTGTIHITASAAGITMSRDVPVTATYSPPPPQLTVDKGKVVFFIDPYSPADRAAILNLTGTPADLPWMLDSAPDWTVVTPTSGVMGSSGATARLAIVVSNLKEGDNTGVIQFSATKYGVTVYQTVQVTVFYQQYLTYFFPFLRR